jgi:hypothetical protein
VVSRNHLPGGRLLDNLFPLLVAPERTEATMILPGRFWPLKLVQSWMRE